MQDGDGSTRYTYTCTNADNEKPVKWGYGVTYMGILCLHTYVSMYMHLVPLNVTLWCMYTSVACPGWCSSTPLALALALRHDRAHVA